MFAQLGPISLYAGFESVFQGCSCMPSLTMPKEFLLVSRACLCLERCCACWQSFAFLCTCLHLQSVPYTKGPYLKDLSPPTFIRPFLVCKAPPYLPSLWLFVESFLYSQPLLVCLAWLNFPGWGLCLFMQAVLVHTDGP